MPGLSRDVILRRRRGDARQPSRQDAEAAAPLLAYARRRAKHFLKMLLSVYLSYTKSRALAICSRRCASKRRMRCHEYWLASAYSPAARFRAFSRWAQAASAGFSRAEVPFSFICMLCNGSGPKSDASASASLSRAGADGYSRVRGIDS